MDNIEESDRFRVSKVLTTFLTDPYTTTIPVHLNRGISISVKFSSDLGSAWLIFGDIWFLDVPLDQFQYDSEVDLITFSFLGYLLTGLSAVLRCIGQSEALTQSLFLDNIDESWQSSRFMIYRFKFSFKQVQVQANLLTRPLSTPGSWNGDFNWSALINLTHIPGC